MNILALDPATHCGWAMRGAAGTWDLSIRRDESSGMKLIRLRSKIAELYKADAFDLLVFEAARNAGPKMQGALVVQSELQAVIKLWCQDNDVQFRGYSPTEIKKHATGKGNANKTAMLDAARVRWGTRVLDDNQADALWLLDLAVREYDSAKGIV